MALLAPSNILDSGVVGAGVTPTLTTGDTAAIGTGHNTFVLYRNASVSSITVTIQDYAVADNGDTVAAHVVTVPAAVSSVPGLALIPLRHSYDPGTGLATLVPSAVTSVTAQVLVAN